MPVFIERSDIIPGSYNAKDSVWACDSFSMA